MVLKGRKKILAEYSNDELRDVNNLITVLNNSRPTHLINKVQIDYLVNYRSGVQPILDKVKLVREEINNKLVINHAQMITRNIIGYFLGTPIQYIQSGADFKEEIDMLNKYVAYEDKANVDKEIGEYQSVCGTGYRIIYTDGELADEVPFEDKALDPSATYVVYENNIAERPLVGVTYYNTLNEKGNVVGVTVYAYTRHGLYTFKTKTGQINVFTPEPEFQAYDVGGIPIIEYPNNMWRIGDWELCLGLMNAISIINSGRLDDIDQIVQSLLVFINADIDEDKYTEMREGGIVLLKNTTNNASDVKTVTVPLDQAGMHLFAEEMESLLYALIGIPDRNNRAGGGGDTGQAVELRDGWADLEIIARNKEVTFKKAEKQTLRIILTILNNNSSKSGKLSLLDIDIKFSRNKNNNLMVKTQSYQTLLNTKTLSPEDCLTIVDLVSDVNEFIARGKVFWGGGFAGVEQGEVALEQSKVSLETSKNPPEVTVEKNTIV